MARSKWLSLVFLCVLAAGGLIAALIRWPNNLWTGPPVALASGTLLAPPRALADFNLIDNQGRSFGGSRLRGHWSMMFFGYTHCPDYCPTTLTTLATLAKQLRATGSAPPQVIFVSVDARRDTPAQLNSFVPAFDPAFTGLTAESQPAIEALAKRWGIAVAIRSAANGDYIVEHSEAIFVIDPAGHLAAILTGPFTVEALLNDYRRIVTARA